MLKVGIVSNDKFINKIKEDLLLKRQLIIDGIDAEILSWENKYIDYTKYDALIIRSVWGYYDKYESFIKWLDKIERDNITIFNDVSIIKNNIRKDLQFYLLDKYNIPHIKTIFQKGYIDISDFKGDWVVKPIISESGVNTYKIENADVKKFSKIINQTHNGVMIQPYIDKIIDGEYAIIFINGINTHNMIRYPGIFTENKKTYEIKKVPSKVMKLANDVKNIPEYKDALYMRVDIVNKNKPMIMEVELIDPDLLTRYTNNKKAIKLLSEKIKGRLL